MTMTMMINGRKMRLKRSITKRIKKMFEFLGYAFLVTILGTLLIFSWIDWSFKVKQYGSVSWQGEHLSEIQAKEGGK